MSNNIHDTKVEKIKKEVYNLLQDIQEEFIETNISTHLQDKLETKYHYLHSTSKTLFNFICKEAIKPTFNKSQFNINLDNMLKHIIKIQKEEISQNTASENIGKLLATQFIPQYKKK
jgi:hypothetical protein